jgi:autotransporter-associated beta strand protein
VTGALRGKIAVAVAAVATLIIPQTVRAQSWAGTTSNAWLTTTNWTGSVPAGSATVTTNNNIAVFNVPAQPTVGINMNTTAGVYYLGAIDYTNATARTFNNSSTTVGGVLTLNGASVNSVANTILRNTTTTLMTITNGTGAGTLGLELGNATNNVVQITGTGGITINSIVSGTSRNLTLQGGGSGVLTLTGANTYTGTTTVNSGTLNLGGGTANGSLASTTLALAGGSFIYTRTGTNTQSFSATSIGGDSVITGAAGNTLNLGTVTRTGSFNRFHDFATTGLGTVTAATTSNDATGIMPGFNFGDSWAVANGTGVAISGLGGASYTLASAAGTTAANYLNGNIDVDASPGAIGAPIAANSLRFSSAAANTLTLTGSTNTIATGGILVGSGVGANTSTIAGGTLAGATSRDLTVIQNNTAGGLTISSVIANNSGATGLVKSGPGLLTLGAANTFTGGVVINAGSLTLAAPGALNGTAGSENAVTFSAGSTGTLALNGNSVVIRGLDGASGSGVVENGGNSNATLTIGNAGNASSSFAGIIRNGAGAGVLALTKAGTGTLALAGANTYTGNTTLAAGTVAISNATSFGAGNVLVTGASKISAVGGITYANAINVGAGLTLQIPSAAPGTATYSGQLTGSSNITVEATLVNAVTGTHAFTNSNNTFTGSVLMPIGSTGSGSGNDFFSFNSIGDGGTFTFRKRGHTNGIIYTGTAPITFNVRQIAVSADFGGQYDGGGVNPVNRFLNNGTGTVTFNTNLTPGTINIAGFFYFGGTNTGNNTFAGVISNPSNLNLGIGKVDAGRWILTGANSFDGEVRIDGGTLAFNSVAASSATNQPLGNNTVIQLGHQGSSGTLEFIGTDDSLTDKQIRIGNTTAAQSGAGSIVNNGTGTLTFTNATFNPAIAGITAIRTLTLGGSGISTIEGVIQNNAAGGVVNLSKTGAGIWTLAGANTYTGTTTVSAGILRAMGASPTGAGAVTVNGTGTLAGTGTITGAISVSASGKIAPGTSPGTLTATSTVTMAAGTTLEVEVGRATGGLVPGTDYDQLVLTNNVLSVSATTLLSVIDLPNTQVGDQFVIVANAGTTPTMTNTFAGGPTVTGNTGNVYSISYTGNDGNDVVLTAVTVIPEPGTIGLAAVAGIGLLAGRRRRPRT